MVKNGNKKIIFAVVGIIALIYLLGQGEEKIIDDDSFFSIGPDKKLALTSTRYFTMCSNRFHQIVNPYDGKCTLRGNVDHISPSPPYHNEYTDELKDCFEDCNGHDYSDDICFVFSEGEPCSDASTDFGETDYCRYQCIIGGDPYEPCENECTIDDTKEEGGKCYKCVEDDDNFGAQCNEWVWTNDEFCGGACVDFSWNPDHNTICSEIVFTQTSNCDNTRLQQGTKDCGTETCNTAADKDCNGCVQDSEFPTAVSNWKNQLEGITDALFPSVVSKWKNQHGC